MSARIKFAISFFHTLHTPITSALRYQPSTIWASQSPSASVWVPFINYPLRSRPRTYRGFCFYCKIYFLGRTCTFQKLEFLSNTKSEKKFCTFPIQLHFSLYIYANEEFSGVSDENTREDPLGGFQDWNSAQKIRLFAFQSPFCWHTRSFYLCSALVCKWVLAAELSWWFSCLLLYS